LSVPAQPDLLPLATMPDQTKTTDEQRVPDRIVQDVLSASLEPTKANHIEGTLEIISFTSTEKLSNSLIINDHDEYFDVESESPNEIIKADVTSISLSEKPPITLAEAEKIQHDAANDDFYEAQVELTPTNVSATVKHFTSIESKAKSLPFLSPLLPTKTAAMPNVSTEKSANKKKEKAIPTIQQTISDKKSKTNGSHRLVDKNEEQLTDEQKSTETMSDKHSTKSVNQIVSHEVEKLKSTEDKKSPLQNVPDKKKKDQIIIEKLIPAESLDQKPTNKVQSLKTPSVSQNESSQIDASIETSSIITPIIQTQQELLRPKFSLRLKPTITVNHEDKLPLEVHFIGQPEPEVNQSSFHITIHCIIICFYSGNMVF